jgi:hypothetical protein
MENVSKHLDTKIIDIHRKIAMNLDLESKWRYLASTDRRYNFLNLIMKLFLFNINNKEWRSGHEKRDGHKLSQ